jgi:small subunit ribosomal protein S29
LVFYEALSILSKQTDVPVLLTADDINAFSSKLFAENRDTDNNQVYVGDLQLPRLILKYLSGDATFERGVVAVAATSNFAVNDTIVCGLGLKQPDSYYTSPYDYDMNISKSFNGVQPVQVPRFSQEETRVAVEYLHAATVLKEDLSDAIVREKYFLSGNGNPSALMAACTMSAI